MPSFSIRRESMRLAAVVFAAALAVPATAQHSLSASADVVAGIDSNQFGGGAFSNGAPVSFSDTLTFHGKDSSGNPQTMVFSGTGAASAEFGRLHTYATGTITNPYYNPANPVYFDGTTLDPNGSPAALVVHGSAVFDDTFLYTGQQGTGYKARYIYHVSGLSSGTSPILGSATLNFTAGGDPVEVFGTSDPFAIWATQDHDVVWGQPFNVHALFFASFGQLLDQNYPAYTEGVTISGTADYSSTLTLAGIEIRDPSGNLAGGWNLIADSGAAYPLIRGQAVPEPGSLALLCGLSLAAGVSRVRRRR